ncbi:MAG TPA: hypothetical protein VJA85_04205 [Candidatus Limnocylindria bacterium]|nr:hypothetical protein [Candidatus Limnocylindria bacterium]
MFTRARSRPLAIAALIATLVAFPMASVASDIFSDVPDSNIFHDDINAIYEFGVTTGCAQVPLQYCPDNFVTRGQMAAFMNRLGALGPGKTPVVNATTLDGFSAGDLTRFAFNEAATDALVGASGTVIAVDINAPTRGWLHIVASSDTYGSGNDAFSCGLTVNNVSIAASDRQLFIDPGSGNPEENCSTNGTWITCGGSLAVRLVGINVDAETTFDEATIEVTFHPLNGVGAQLPLFVCAT